jgi:hypothetical protein
MAFLPIFYSPFHSSVQVQLHQVAPQVTFHPAYMQVTMQRSIEYVGCIVIANSRSGVRSDIIMPYSHTKNAYDVLGGDISGRDDPIQCINSLMSQFNIRIDSRNQYFDVTNDTNGKLCRIYVEFVGDISVSDLTQRIVYNRVLSGAYAHLNRFPVTMRTNTHTNIDSNGNPKTFLSFASKVMQITKENFNL